MSFIDALKNLFSSHKDKLQLPDNMNSVEELKAKLPEDMNTVEEVKAKAGELLEQHADVIDHVTAKIPGEIDDQIVEKITNTIK